MKKRYEYYLVDRDNNPVWGKEDWVGTRSAARNCLKQYKKDIFEHWNADLKWPLAIRQRVWVLEDDRKVR